MNLSLLASYCLAVMLLILTPGPVVALITATAARDGQRKAFMTMLGTNGASLLLLTVSVLTLAGIVQLSPGYLSLLGIGGSLYIGYGAVRELLMIKNAAVTDPHDDTLGVLRHTGNGNGWVRGFVTGIANPKDILFFVSFFPQFIAITHNFSTSVVTLSAVWVLLDLTILSLYIIGVKWWSQALNSRWIEGACAVFLLIIAVGGVIYNSHSLVA